MKNIFCILFSLIFLFGGCKKNIDELPKSKDYKEIKVDLKNTNRSDLTFNDFFKLKEYIKLNTDSSNIPISRISSALFSSNRIFVSDIKANIFIFDRKGMLKKILSKGRGPSEFNNLSDIQYDKQNDELYVFSDTPNKGTIYVYNYDGEFKRTFEFPIPIDRFILLDSNHVIGYTNHNKYFKSSGLKSNYNQLFYLEKNKNKWKIIYEDLPFPKQLVNINLNTDVTTRFCISDENKIYFTPPFNSSIYVFNFANKMFEKDIYFNFGKNTIPDDSLSRLQLWIKR